MTEDYSVGGLPPTRVEVRPKRLRSLANRFSIFTALLVLWVVVTLLFYDARDHKMEPARWLVLCTLVVLVAAAISRFTTRLIARPLQLLREGITSVKNGRLEPIQISRTGDEIEDLGDAFNEMIRALAASRAEVREYQELLEDRIRQRTEELENAMHRALAASRAKSEFLANVSHELRTPMNGVIGMLDIVLDGRMSLEQRDHLDTAQRCAYSLLAIVNDLLDLSKIEAGKMALENVPFDLRQLVADCAKAHIPAAADKGVAVALTVGEDVPERVVGDPLRVRQILTNLVGNAVKFTEAGSVRIDVNLSARKAETAEIELTVRDTGTGIPADRLPFIFDKFTQADGSISRRYGGTGLGLTITRRLVEMHGGEIHVESEVGRGSRFQVRLTFGNTSQKPVAAPASTEAAGPRRSAQPGRRLLVVEDNLVNQKVVTAMLHKHGYETDIANHGQEALELLRQAPGPGYYGMVLMDVQMPVLDGLEATRLIRNERRWDHLPIVAMTAHAMNGDRDQCLRAGMNGYISKPVDPAYLAATVERLVRREPGLPERARGEQGMAMLSDSGQSSPHLGTDQDLVEGMIHVFLQLAPERLQRLFAAARRRDSAKLIEESEKISSAAQRIAATGVSDCTREITNAAGAEDYAHVQQSLVRLAEEISHLHQKTPVV